MKKKWNLFVSLINLIYENTIDCEIAGDCVKPANVVVGLWKEIFARTHSYPQADMCSAPYSNHDDTHLIIVCGAPRPTAWWGNNIKVGPLRLFCHLWS